MKKTLVNRLIGLGAMVGTLASLAGASSIIEKKAIPPPAPLVPVQTPAQASSIGCAIGLKEILEQHIDDGRHARLLLSAYQALIDHESKCDQFAVSKTGAAGYFQLTVPTAHALGVKPLYAPGNVFRSQNGRLAFRNASLASRMAYGTDLKNRIRRPAGNDDTAAVARFDARFYASENIRAGIANFEENRKSNNIRDVNEAIRAAFIAHNAGPQGSSYADAIIEREKRRAAQGNLKSQEIVQFFNGVDGLFEYYKRINGIGTRDTDETSPFVKVRNRSSDGFEVFSYHVEAQDTRTRIARIFNDWDLSRGDLYDSVPVSHVVLGNGRIPGLLNRGQLLYVKAKKKP